MTEVIKLQNNPKAGTLSKFIRHCARVLHIFLVACGQMKGTHENHYINYWQEHGYQKAHLWMVLQRIPY
jgi:hypothetical protein